MLITQKSHGIPIRKHYFSTVAPGWRDYLLPSAWLDSYINKKPVLFHQERRHTLLTDLSVDEARIFQNFPKDTRNQIRRCEREQHFTLSLHTPLEQFIPLYNHFAQERRLSPFSYEDAANIGHDNYRIFSVDHEGQPIICHLYLLSAATGVINLLISAATSKYNHDTEMRKIMGHANRCLHWQGMRHFKTAGFHTYDWGGYVLNTDDPTMQGINRFKRTFQGTLTPIYNYYSPAYTLIEKVRKIIR